MTETMEHPITRATIKLERAKGAAARLDAWTRDPANQESADWDYQYREMRRAECRVRRLRVAILRLDRALYDNAEGFDYEGAMAKVQGLRAWCNRPAWRS